MLHKLETHYNVIVILIYSCGDDNYLKLLSMMIIYYDVFEHEWNDSKHPIQTYAT